MRVTYVECEMKYQAAFLVSLYTARDADLHVAAVGKRDGYKLREDKGILRNRMYEKCNSRIWGGIVE
jgi:hypothetical protein